MFWVRVVDDGQNTDPQTTPKNNNPNEYYLMFLAASIIKLHMFILYSL